MFGGILVVEPLEDKDVDDGIITGTQFEMQTIGAQPELGGEGRLREVELCGIPRVGGAEEDERECTGEGWRWWRRRRRR